MMQTAAVIGCRPKDQFTPPTPKIRDHLVRRRRRHRVASSSRRVVPSWSRSTDCLQRLAGTNPVLWRSWSVQRARGRPGRRLQSQQSERQEASRLDNVGHRVLEPSGWAELLWPNTGKQRLLMKSITDGKPVWTDISAFVVCWNQWMLRLFSVGISCGIPPTFIATRNWCPVFCIMDYHKSLVQSSWSAVWIGFNQAGVCLVDVKCSKEQVISCRKLIVMLQQRSGKYRSESANR